MGAKRAGQRVVWVACLAMLVSACGKQRVWEPPAPAAQSQRDPAGLVVEPQVDLSHFRPNTQGVLQATFDADVTFKPELATVEDAAVTLIAEAAGEVTAAAYTGPMCVEGFADGMGETQYNQDLSQQRAQAVADILHFVGLANEMQVFGRGETNAVDNQDDPSQRRVDVTLAPCPDAAVPAAPPETTATA